MCVCVCVSGREREREREREEEEGGNSNAVRFGGREGLNTSENSPIRDLGPLIE